MTSTTQGTLTLLPLLLMVLNTDSTGVVRRSPYNLFTYSEELENVLWLKNNITIVANAGTAPNNTNTAESYASTTTVGPHPCYQSKVVTRGTYTYSVYVKKVNSRYISLKGAGGMTVWTGVIFDLDTASVVSVQHNNVPGTTGSVTSEGDGWYRLSMTATSNFNDFGLQYASSPSNSFGNYGDLSIAGSGLVDYLLWGMQVVQGSSPLPYFPTTTRLNVPRIDYRNADGSLSTVGRLLLEPQRTNSIRNSSMVGAVAGSPGTLPTNWSSSTSGLVQTVVGAGIENGLPYVDLRFAGTAINTLLRIFSETSTQIAAVNAQTWGHSIYVKRISGTFDSAALGYAIRGAGGTGLGAPTSPITVTTTLQRLAYVAAVNNASTQFVQPLIDFVLTVGQTYDFTIRLAAPQMELGAYATTWIPTTTAAVTRNADVASRTGVSSWIGQTQGTLFTEVDFTQTGTEVYILSLGSAGVDTISIRRLTSGEIRCALTAATSSGTTNASSAALPNGRYKLAYKYSSGSIKLFINGALSFTLTPTFTFGSALSSLFLGMTTASTGQLSDRLSQSILFPTSLTDDQCIQLTTL